MKQNKGATEILILLIYYYCYYYCYYYYLQVRRIASFAEDVSISVIVLPSARSIVGKFLQAQFSKLILILFGQSDCLQIELNF